jgi:class 3 adenylate cyclase
MHRRDHRFFPQRLGQQLAASIPHARLALVDGNSFYPWFEQPESVLGFVNAFAPPGPALQPEARAPRAQPVAGAAVRTVLFTDLVGHTEMMRRLGDERGRAVLREHEQITREHIGRFGGTEIKTDGDSFMVSFASVTAAVDCAVELQRGLARRNDTAADPLRVRIGLDAGEPIEEQGDLFGSTVIMASRIAAQAGAGEILIPDLLRHLLSGKSYVYADRGETMLKGFEDAVRLYEVRWRE